VTLSFQDDQVQEQTEKVMVLEHKCRALQTKLVDEQVTADHAKAAENEVKARVIELEALYKNEKEKLFCIVSDMTRQYKQMQDELLKEINKLKQTVIDKDEIISNIISYQYNHIENKEAYIQEINKDYEYRLKKKDDEINDLKRRIEEMSAEFAKMLKDTLDKMSERIELA
jgi:hypothetical protein